MTDKKYTCAVFDLDGTLLNTLEDLCDSMNYALKHLGFPERTLEETRTFVGNGLINLAKRSLPAGFTEEQLNELMAVFIPHYSANMQNKTAPYEGVIDILKELKAKGVKIAVITNKADSHAQPLCREMFGEYPDFVQGEKAGIAKKPAPDGCWKALEILGVKKEDAVYIGDSEVDIATAENSQLDFIGCSWGFRGRKFLEEKGARNIADAPVDILEYF